MSLDCLASQGLTNLMGMYFLCGEVRAETGAVIGVLRKVVGEESTLGVLIGVKLKLFLSLSRDFDLAIYSFILLCIAISSVSL